jgi:uncharacterized protein
VSEKDVKKQRMTLATLEKLMERIAEYLAVDSHRRVGITWHGGEPALMGIDFFRAAGILQKEMLGPAASRLQHSIQSNLTVMSEELAQCYVDLGIKSVGSSYDMSPGVRTIGDNHDSDVYNRKFFRGLEIIHRHGIGTGIIFVVTSHVVQRPVETIIFLTNLLGKRYRGHFRLNPMYMEGEALLREHTLSITAEQYGHFLGKAYQYWYPRRHILCGIAPFSGLSQIVEGIPTQMSCEELGSCGDTHLSVAPNGDIYQCGRAMDNGILRYGSIYEQSFSDTFETPLKKSLMRRSSKLRVSDCASCDLWEYCHGGCPIDGHIAYQEWQHKTYYCGTKHILFPEYIYPIHGKGRVLQAARGA